MKKLYLFILALIPFCFFSQTYQWQWAKAGGGYHASGGSGMNELQDELIRDIVIDNQNNHYYLTKIFPNNPNIDGTAVTNYQNSDLLIFSTDCNGNFRWSRTIGGAGDAEDSWKLRVDNQGGLYLMAYCPLFVNNTSNLPIRFGDNDIKPYVTTPPFTYTMDEGYKSAFLLKYNTSNGQLVWRKNLQGDVNFYTYNADVGLWDMDSSNNIHAILGFKVGTHLDGLITVPSSYTDTLQYYLVKFVFNSTTGTMTPTNPILLPVTGNFLVGIFGGKVQFLFDESLNRYYIAGSTSQTFTDYQPLSYNNVPFSNDGYMFAISGAPGHVGELLWKKEFSTYINGNINSSANEKIFSLIKDQNSNLYISGRYYTDQQPNSPLPTFGNDTLPPVQKPSNVNFVMKLNPSGNVLWTKTHTVAGDPLLYTGTPSMRARIALNGNEVAFVKGVVRETWDSFVIMGAPNDVNNSLLVRLNKDTGNTIAAHEIKSQYGTHDELTSIAVDNDGNYIVGGYFSSPIFTDPNDNIPTISFSGIKSDFYVAKFAKNACGQMATEEVGSLKDIRFYPNPVTETLLIDSKETLLNYEIYSLTGQVIKKGNFDTTKKSISVSNLTTGTYLVKVHGKKGEYSAKIIKK